MQASERMNDFMLALDAATSGLQARLWTAMPGIVEAYDPENQTATIQGAIKPQVLDATAGAWKDVTLPLFGKVPVAWPGGGGFSMSFPLKKGDEGIVLFAKNCLDAWWQSGGIQSQIEVRQHDLSDAMFVPGLRSVPRKLEPTPSATRVQLRADDGLVYIEMGGEPGAGTVAVVAPGGISLTGPLTINGVLVTQPGAGVLRFGAALESTGHVTAKAGTPGSVTLDTHGHPANNTPPTPGS